MEHATRGAKALAASDANTAVEAYTKALIEHPTSPDYFTQRSIAFTRLKPARYDLALQDAEFGVICGQKRGKRDKIQAAQQRRVVCLYNLGRYADAKLVLDGMLKWRPSNSKPQEMEHKMWEAKIVNKLQGTGHATVTEYPDESLFDEKAVKKLLQSQLKRDGTFNYEGEDSAIDISQETTSAPTSQSTNSASTSATQTTTSVLPQKIRHEWYQNNQSVIITIYAKGVAKDKIDVDIEDDSVSVAFPHPSDPSSAFTFNLDPLFALIDPARSKYQVMSTKVELTLAKAVAGQKWANTEGIAPLKKTTNDTTDADPAKAAILSTLQQPASTTNAQPVAAPSYPTSSRSGPKNWDKLASDLTAKKPKKSAKGKDKSKGSGSEDEDDDDYDSDVGGDAVDGFFKKLYAGADPDTRRAMMKSFTESNGTALSTNWNEVGQKKVDVVKSKSDD